MDLYAIVEDFLVARWRTRGRRCRMSPLDAFVMFYVYVRHYMNFSVLAKIFDCKDTAARDTVSKVLETVRAPLVENLVKLVKKHEQLTQSKFSFLF